MWREGIPTGDARGQGPFWNGDNANYRNAPLSHSPSWTVEQADRDFDIQNMGEDAQVDADFNNIAVTELEEPNHTVSQAQWEFQMDIVNVDWKVTVQVGWSLSEQ